VPLLTPEQLTPNKQGRSRTKSLFVETNTYNGFDPVLTLGSRNKDYPSLRDYYISLVPEDPSEYSFAEAVFGDFMAWEKVRTASWFQPWYEEYQLTASAIMKSLAFKAIIQEAKGGKSAFTAAKFLIDEPWKVKDATDKRKARAQTRASTKAAAESHDFQEDIKRLKELDMLQ